MYQRKYSDRFQCERDEHRVFAADMVRDPSKERPGESVQNTIKLDGEYEGCPAESNHHFIDMIELRNGAELGGHRESAESHQSHHQIDQPKRERANHLARCETHAALAHFTLLLALQLFPSR